jgi:hypothetical protein
MGRGSRSSIYAGRATTLPPGVSNFAQRKGVRDGIFTPRGWHRGVQVVLEAHYSRLFNEAMERAAKISEPSLVAAYLEQAKHWLGRLERAALKPKGGGVEKQMNGGK